MHRSAMIRMEWFVNQYIPKDQHIRILDVGSCDVNGSYKALFTGFKAEYVGLDMVAGSNVDYVPDDPYVWNELEDDTFDYIISGNAFEHIEYPWLTIEQIRKKLKIGGITCIIAPNSTHEHRFPVDCYRYFSDGLVALAKWGGLKVINCTVSGIPDDSVTDDWVSGHNDTMLIAVKQDAGDDKLKYPVFKNERRYLHAYEWEARYRFLVKWINEPDISKTIISFLERQDIRRIYLYGYGEIGKLFYQQLKMIGREFFVIDKNNNRFKDKTILSIGDPIDENDDSMMICTVLDMGIIEELRIKYRKIKINLVSDIFEGK